ncbi:MAG: stage III sporulation protein AA, partial [Clostridia bacterium]|nr:stage III sporulation protein AA [Clostridia bacterium]
MAKVFINKEKSYEGLDKEGISPVSISSLTWFQALSPQLQELVSEGLQAFVGEVEEIRLRVKRPVLFRVGTREMTVTAQKKFTFQLEQGYVITRDELERTMQILSQNSLYAWEDEFKNGYLTIPGGHRIGFVGRGVLEQGKIKTLKDLSGINYRIGRQVLGCADEVLPYLVKKEEVRHTLIISPPQCGKTTLLRDLVRQISTGVPELSFTGVNVGLVDERSEIAGMYQGEPQFQIGLRTDVLDACPKAQGMIMLIRSMSPRVVATDEIGKNEDIEALHNALQAGVKVITTVHGSSFEEIKTRPHLQTLINWHFFERIIVLSRRKGVGTLEMILD